MVRQARDLGAETGRLRHVLEQLVDRFGADLCQHVAAIGLGLIGVAIVVKISFWNGAMTAKMPSSDRIALKRRERSS